MQVYWKKRNKRPRIHWKHALYMPLYRNCRASKRTCNRIKRALTQATISKALSTPSDARFLLKQLNKFSGLCRVSCYLCILQPCRSATVAHVIQNCKGSKYSRLQGMQKSGNRLLAKLVLKPTVNLLKKMGHNVSGDKVVIFKVESRGSDRYLWKRKDSTAAIVSGVEGKVLSLSNLRNARPGIFAARTVITEASAPWSFGQQVDFPLVLSFPIIFPCLFHECIQVPSKEASRRRFRISARIYFNAARKVLQK